MSNEEVQKLGRLHTAGPAGAGVAPWWGSRQTQWLWQHSWDTCALYSETLSVGTRASRVMQTTPQPAPQGQELCSVGVGPPAPSLHLALSFLCIWPSTAGHTKICHICDLALHHPLRLSLKRQVSVGQH